MLVSPAYFYSKEDITKLIRMYNDLYTLAQIATELQKSLGSVQQKVHRLDLPPRDNNLIRMINIHGRDILKYGRTIEAIKAGRKADSLQNRADRAGQAARRQKAAVSQLKAEIMRGVERNTAMKTAFANGALLHQIGSVVGMTKQGVSQIVKGK